jgi:predicted metal-dependent hydrolase
VSYPLPAQRDALALRLGGPWATVPTRVLAWYRVEALSLFAARLAFHAMRMGVPVPVMRLSDARTRWGSLSAHGRMGLNWRLILLSEDLLDYVICHELAHLRQHNHSPAFWREVEALYPDYRAARVRLKQRGAAAMGFNAD